MNDRPVRPAPPPPYRRPWSLAGALERLLALLSMVALGWLLSIALEWGGMAFDLWEEPGAGHSTRLLQTELTWLRQDLAPITGPPRLWDWTQEGAVMGAKSWRSHVSSVCNRQIGRASCRERVYSNV